jgi:hypothetical protein
MARIKTFVNGGSLLPGDLNSIEDDYETTFAAYKAFGLRSNYRLDAPGSGTFVIVPGGNGTGVVASSGATAGLGMFYVDPAWVTASTRSNYWRVQAGVLVNNTAPTVNFTVGLYPVSSPAGGAAAMTMTLGTVVTGSTCVFNTPGANSETAANSGDFAAGAAGWYCFGVVVSGASAANSAILCLASLQYRQV